MKPEQIPLEGFTPQDAEMVELRERDFEKRFGDYWAQTNTAWGAERLKRTVVGIIKELMVVAEAPRVDNGRVGALKGAGELCLRLLNKLEPDLKAIEMTGNVGVSHEDALAQLEFSVRLAEEAEGKLPALRGDVPENPH